MDTINAKVSGMSCAVCASTVKKTIESQGAEHVLVNFATGDVAFDLSANRAKDVPKILASIDKLGYKVVDAELPEVATPFYKTLLFRFVLSAVLTLPLLAHMFVHNEVLANPWFQFALGLPVYLIGLASFGKMAWRSMLNRMPDMHVLVLLGATAAFIYSLVGLFVFPAEAHNYLFFETAATIITLILLGKYIEERTVARTSSSINELVKLQRTPARRVATDASGNETIEQVDSRALLTGDIVVVNTGDLVPIDGTIVRGDASADESMLTGESAPQTRRVGDRLIGGSILSTGSVRLEVTAVGRETVLSHLIELVKQAQNEKPVMQQLVDRISAIFVPTVIAIALLTFVVWYFIVGSSLVAALMPAIAVLVVACPCALGLATPLAMMVGLGRAAKNGILIKGSNTLEKCKQIAQVAFDKTGTLTTGQPTISAFDSNTPELLMQIATALESHSSHPIARAINNTWSDVTPLVMDSVHEERGKGLFGTSGSDNYFIGAARSLKTLPEDASHQLYVTHNDSVVGWIDLEEQIRPNVAETIAKLKQQRIEAILLSGDNKEKCRVVAEQVGITQVYAEQLPEQKLQRLDSLMQTAATAMVGDGINDAPALAKATIGISLSDASQIAMQQADIILINGRIDSIPLALELGKQTFVTIKQNLFWALFYNVITIPLAAFGVLSPAIAAGSMAFSSLFLVVNSWRLKVRKID